MSAVVESREEDFLSQELQGGRDRDGDQRPDDAQQCAADQDGHHGGQGRHLHRSANDPRHQEVILG